MKTALHNKGLSILLDYWLPLTAIDDPKRLEAAILVNRIGGSLGILDEQQDNPFLDNAVMYQTQVIIEAINGEVRQLFSNYLEEIEQYNLRFDNIDGLPDYLRPARMAPVIDVNKATIDELIDLPGFGPISARRILDKIKAEGPFGDLETVKRAARVTSKAFEEAASFLKVSTPTRPHVTDLSQEKIRLGGLPELIKELGYGNIELDIVSNEGPVLILLDLLSFIANKIEENRFRPRYWKPSKERLERGEWSMLNSNWIVSSAKQAKGISPISSGTYFSVLQQLIDQATKRIWTSMFFFHVDEDPGSPGVVIINKLTAAKARGVDVRIILDHDLEEDYHGARLVNHNALRALRKSAIAVRQYLPDQTLHGKMVIVDGEFVLLGSHNWTASSFYRYEETSLLVSSESLNQDVAEFHNEQWELLAKKARIPLAQMELLTVSQVEELRNVRVRNDSQFIKKAKLKKDRIRLANTINATPGYIDMIKDVLLLMKAFRISETTAVALVYNKIETVSKVKRASLKSLTAALEDLSNLPYPFYKRKLPAGVPLYIRKF